MAAALAGLIAGPINPVLLTVIQENTPSQILGRTFGAMTAISQVGIPVGAVLAGFAPEVADIALIIGVMGAAYLAATGP